MDGVGDHGEALVADQTGDAGDEGHIRVLLEANSLLQGGLAGGLALGDVL